MSVVVEQEALYLLARHARIPIGFSVDRVLEVSLPGGSGLKGIALREVAVEQPWWSDDDAGEGNAPQAWAARFDLTHWGLLGAYEDHERVGGAVIAHRTPGLGALEGRDDLAALWDLRVAAAARGRGIGSALYRAAEEWAGSRGCHELTAETQNVNVPASRFCARMGCVLGAINRHADPERPGRARLRWYRTLLPPTATSVSAPSTSSHG